MPDTVAAPTNVQIATDWPAFPVLLREAAGATVGAALYAGLGSAGQAWYRLDTQCLEAGWQRMADFPALPPNGAACAASGSLVFVLGGAVQAEAQPMRQSDAVWCYDTASDQWRQLDTALPLGLLGASALTRDDGGIVVFGGYHRGQFDAYCRAHAAAGEAERAMLQRTYMARPVADFEWNRRQWLFDAASGALTELGALPFPGTCGAAAFRIGGWPVLAGGEIKPGLRTLLSWHALPDGSWRQAPLPATAQGEPQEGVAAAFGGLCGGVAVLAGGTNFPGAGARYAQQHLYAHAGLAKVWRRELYYFDGRDWHLLGLLPRPRAHGLAFQVGSTLLLVGGDTDGGAAMLETWSISLFITLSDQLSDEPAHATVSHPA